MDSPMLDMLRKRLRNREDGFTERKAEGVSTEDIRKTLVAFANSVPEGEQAILYIGVSDDGSPLGVTNTDSLQKDIRRIAEGKCYPPIKAHTCKVFEESGKNIVAVLVVASSSKPHFAGTAYVRVGSESIAAPETVYEQMLAKWKLLKIEAGIKLLPYGETKADDFGAVLSIAEVPTLFINLANPDDRPIHLTSVHIVPESGKEIELTKWLISISYYNNYVPMTTVEPYRGRGLIVKGDTLAELLLKEGLEGEIRATIVVRSELGLIYNSPPFNISLNALK